MASELPGEPTTCSLMEPTHWELLNLLDTVGQRNGRLLVMEMDDAHERSPLVLMDFAQDLFGAVDLKAKLQQKEMTEEEQEPEPQPQPQLAFMLWQATTLKQLMQWDHLDETLWNLRSLFPSMPAVLVLVMVQPDPQRQPEQTAEALRRMQCLLDGAFQELVVEAAVYSPGQPDGILEVKRAACRALREVLKGREEITSQDPFTIWLSLTTCDTRYQRQFEDGLS
ncbi:uncharacterized protein [Struthio camelus]